MMKILSKDKAAEFLGISVATIAALRKRYADFPDPMSFGAAKNGRKVFWLQSDLEDWINRNAEVFKNNAKREA